MQPRDEMCDNEQEKFSLPEEYRQVVEEFHHMWDAFPGPARLITNRHVVLAVNDAAREGGFYEGCICATIRSPETHRGCKMPLMFKTKEAQQQRFDDKKIKGWIPVSGYPELCVHYAITIPSLD